MSELLLLLTYIFVTILFISSAILAISFKFSLNLKTKIVLSILFVLLLSANFIGLTKLLSLPKPQTIEFLKEHHNKVELLESHIIYKKSIYLWMLFPGETMPRSYIFPWNETLAKAIKKKMDEYNKNQRRGKLFMKNPFKYNWDKSLEMRDMPEDLLDFVLPEKLLPSKPYEKRESIPEENVEPKENKKEFSI